MTNDQITMTKEIPRVQSPKKKVYDLCERTQKFGAAILGFAKDLPVNSITRPLIEQLVRSGTSVGANYCEADDAATKRDFIYRLRICLREAKESRYWLQMMLKAMPEVSGDVAILSNEAKELVLIFASIVHKSQK